MFSIPHSARFRKGARSPLLRNFYQIFRKTPFTAQRLRDWNPHAAARLRRHTAKRRRPLGETGQRRSPIHYTDLKKGVKEPVITAIDISGSGERQLFSFRPSEEATATAEIAPSIEKYLYEPNAAVMKAGAFKGVGMRYGLKKLDTHSHLYTSAHMEESFCGRVFAVREQWEFNKHNLQAIRTHYVAAHVSTRNFPLGSDALRQRLKIKEGGHAYLFGTTVNRSLYIIACDRIR